MSTAVAVIESAETIWSTLGATRLFRGRLGVLGLQARTMICYGVVLACGSSVRAIMAASKVNGEYDYSPLARVSGWTLIGIAIVALAIATVNLMRRLNDLDCSRWWLLLSFIPPVNIFLHLWLYLWPGNDDVNRFGDVPLPGQFERLIGRIGLGVMVVMLIGGMWRLETLTPPERQRDKLDAHDATLSRFTAGEFRATDP